MLDLIAILVVLSALLAYISHRFLHLPVTIGVMVTALVLSLAVILLDALGLASGLREAGTALVREIDFSQLLLQGFLSLLLFAGAMHVDLPMLRRYRWTVGSAAVLGTLVSALIVGFGTWLLLPSIGVRLPLVWSLLFGALIAPTDPVAVIGILRASRAPPELEVIVSGESLFNDGVGITFFLLLLGVVTQGAWPSAETALLTFAHEAAGGLAFGVLLGACAFFVLRPVDEYGVEVLVTLAVAVGGYALADHLGVSGPLAMVAAGIITGNQGRSRAMSGTTWRYVDTFWELIDDILNVMLFMLIGLEALSISFSPSLLVAGAGAVALTLVARALSAAIPMALAIRRTPLPAGLWRLMTWGGLRGGISVALALSLPQGGERQVIVAMTYCVVIFSVLVQGATVGYVARRVAGQIER
ncbi:cation:proton antiporter [Paraburkholderia kururiensis]|uniref:cation:proton antiporter n=1 Tax=Paraburkholderia kururiensis TaxID=984307 RepID=UPI0005A8C251|nr:sodium:proton antiporter [Paraburkholderia kururiensis]